MPSREVVRFSPFSILNRFCRGGLRPARSFCPARLDVIRVPSPAVSHSRLTGRRCAKIRIRRYLRDHMLVADWEAGSWKRPRSFPSAQSLFSRFDSVPLRQAIFEGSKPTAPPAAAWPSFVRATFRRPNRSAARLAIAEIPESLFLGASQIGSLDREWIPIARWRLYIRPTYFGIGRHSSRSPRQPFRLIVMMSRWSYFSNRFVFCPKSASSAPSLGAPVTAKPPATIRRWPPRRRIAQKKGFITSSGWTGSSAVTSKNPAL